MTDSDYIPILDLRADVTEHWDEYMSVIGDVLRSTEFILGREVEAFEEEVAAYLGVEHAIGVNSGTDALVLALRALDIGLGDEVITTPFTFFATAEAISVVGATPVFVDIDATTFNIDPEKISAAVTRRTKAIIPVHLFGRAAPMQEIRSLYPDLLVIEDAAQALGAEIDATKAGTMGNIGAYSFFPSKNLGGFGDGGLVSTDDEVTGERVRMLRTHGGKQKYQNEMIGYNSRLDAVQAAVLRLKLPHLDPANEGRRAVAAQYEEVLSDVPNLVTPPHCGRQHVFHQYTVRIKAGLRDDVATALNRNGIGTMIYYPTPVHRLPVYRKMNATCPVAEQAAREVLSLPIWPSMSDAVIHRVAKELRGVLTG